MAGGRCAVGAMARGSSLGCPLPGVGRGLVGLVATVAVLDCPLVEGVVVLGAGGVATVVLITAVGVVDSLSTTSVRGEWVWVRGRVAVGIRSRLLDGVGAG